MSNPNNNRKLTQERLKEVLRYEPETGNFYWLITRGRAAKGSIAGRLQKDYIMIRIDGEDFLAHRLAWFYMTGLWPELDLDHKNTIKWDNIWTNLREATASQNHFNVGMPITNTLGVKGVYRAKKRFGAHIMIKGVRIKLGFYNTVEEAAEAYEAKSIELHGEFAYKN